MSRFGFLSTPSARRATSRRQVLSHLRLISIHALREEGDEGYAQVLLPQNLFLSTPSARRATRRFLRTGKTEAISIHALREEGDTLEFLSFSSTGNFYPRPPRGGRRVACCVCMVARLFLSTPSARRATPPACRPVQRQCYFYPRPPRGGRLVPRSQEEYGWQFLSTPSARRATAWSCAWRRICWKFLSTPSARRATPVQDTRFGRSIISIHALREEGDWALMRERLEQAYFYPRPPRGGRRQQGQRREDWQKFLSTPSARRATFMGLSSLLMLSNFYPRPPRGGRLRCPDCRLHIR